MFNAEFSAIEKHVRVTYNNSGDLYGDAWIKPNGRPVPTAKPLPAAPPPKPVKVTDKWPGSTDGLVFVWENGSRANEIRDAAGRTVRQCLGRMRGAGRYGRHYEMQLAGGAFLARDADGPLLDACKKANQLTIEATVRTDNLRQAGPARIISFSSDTRSRNFTLGQDRDKLILRLRTPRTGSNGSKPQHTLSRLAAGRTYHVIVTYRPGRLICYLDGKAVFSSGDNWGDFSNWQPHHLLFGDEYSGGRDWSGRVEGIAIYSRFMDAKEVKRHRSLYASRLKTRKAVSRVIVDAKLLAATPTPDPKRLKPYRRCLAESLYEIVKSHRADMREKRIIVAHWVILDAKVIKNDRKVGRIYRLTLEPFDAHPQLESERRVSDIDGLSLRVFYDVGP